MRVNSSGRRWFGVRKGRLPAPSISVSLGVSPAMSHAHASLALRVFLQIHWCALSRVGLGVIAPGEQTGGRRPQGWAIGQLKI